MQSLYWFASIFGFLVTWLPLVFVIGLFFFLRQRKAQEKDIPPLDLVDAKKLDDMVSKQVEEVLKPMLQSKGYNEEQIKEILVRTSLGGKSFRR